MQGKGVRPGSLKRRLAIAATLAVPILPAGGCGGDSTGPVEDITGFYELQTYDGKTIPYESDGTVLWWGELVLARSGITSVILVITTPNGYTGEDSASGTYSLSGNQLEIRFKASGAPDHVVNGTVSGTTIRLVFGSAAVFKRVLVP